MKTLSACVSLAITAAAFARGTPVTVDRITIHGPTAWTSAPPGTYSNAYSATASPGPFTDVHLNGDPQFTISGSSCPGTSSCSFTVSFAPTVGGDYLTQIVARGAHNGTGTWPIRAHVFGANYTLRGLDHGDSTATFTLTSTGESDIVNPTFAVSTYNNVGTAEIIQDTCGSLVPAGSNCTVTVRFTSPPESAAHYGYVIFQTFANTRQQPPVRVTLILPNPPE